MYAFVTQRWVQYNTLSWQVPALSLTAQAFLFTIALSSGNSHYSRAIASGLAVCAALLSMQLLTRQRQAGNADARWIERYERDNFGLTFAPQSDESWIARRREKVAGGILPGLSSTTAWIAGFWGFALVALANLILTFADPQLFRR
jgi:hypothetical protein